LKVLASLVVVSGVSLTSSLTSIGVVGAANAPSYFYLDLGGSASVGFQPTPSDPRGEPTPHGYANDVVAYEAARGIRLHLRELGCPGETTTTMLHGGGNCYNSDDSQLKEALRYLFSHYGQAGIVTLDVGFNNVRPCLANQVVDEVCVESALAEIQQELPIIVSDLQGAAGPQVSFVGLDHYDPYLGFEIAGGASAAFATQTTDVIDRLNAVLEEVYANAGIPVAQVDAGFQGQDLSGARLQGVGEVPENVWNACELTWVCQPAPYGPNFHPNDAGYAIMASAIESALRPPW
jgi:lysophospholipase L1-like esterase